jgi:hypothetical protein
MSTDDWATPHEVDECLWQFNGKKPVGGDPCSNSRSIIRARKRYTVGGLQLPWFRTTYENNPYSNMLRWVEKGAYEMSIGNVDELVTLWPVATSTVWWRRACGLEPIPPFVVGGKEIEISNPTLIFPKRIAFLDHRGKPIKGTRFDSVLFFYGRSEKRHREFRDAFSPLQIRWHARGR